MEIKFIITVGISGSGKSTWIKSYNNSNYIVVSPDEIRKQITDDPKSREKVSDIAFEVAYKRIIFALNKGMSVIFDATNTISYHRKKMLNIIKNNVMIDFNAYAKVFNEHPNICKERVRNDINNKIDRSDIPSKVIDKQYKQFSKDKNKITSDGYILIE